jgi:hypothetical protein
MPGLQKEIWIADIQENPIPDHSFVGASTDVSEHVDNNTLHLQEAGIEPGVHEDYFASTSDELPVAEIEDIPHEVTLKTYSTEQTRHRDLEEVELAYNKKQSVINRHKNSLAKNIGKRAAFAWTPGATNEFNKLMQLGATDSIIDAIIDLQLFYGEHDMSENLNLCLSPAHLARIRKEDKKLYKEIFSEKNPELYGFRLYNYSKTPLFTSAGAKKPFGAVAEAGDLRSSFSWCSDETFRCFGDTEMYETLKHSGFQADLLSFAQRALVGNKRAQNVKYLGGII